MIIKYFTEYSRASDIIFDYLKFHSFNVKIEETKKYKALKQSLELRKC